MSYTLAWQQFVDGDIQRLSLSPDGLSVVVAGADGTCNAFDEDGNPWWRWTAGLAVEDVIFSDQHTCTILSAGEIIRIVDGTEEIRFDTGIQAAAMAVRLGSGLITVGNRFRLFRHFNAAGRVLTRGAAPHTIEHAVWSPRGRALILASADGRISRYERADSHTWTIHLQRSICDIDSSIHGSHVMAACDDGTIALVDGSGAGFDQFALGDGLVGARSDDHGHFVTALGKDGDIRRIELKTGRCSVHLTSNAVDAMDISSDGLTMAASIRSGAGQGLLQLYRWTDRRAHRATFIESFDLGPVRADPQASIATFLEINAEDDHE